MKQTIKFNTALLGRQEVTQNQMHMRKYGKILGKFCVFIVGHFKRDNMRHLTQGKGSNQPEFV